MSREHHALVLVKTYEFPPFFVSFVLKLTLTSSFADGEWLGLELDAAAGRNNGTVNGVFYFDCNKNKEKWEASGKPMPTRADTRVKASQHGHRNSAQHHQEPDLDDFPGHRDGRSDAKYGLFIRPRNIIVQNPSFKELVSRWHSGETQQEYNALIWARNKALLGKTRSGQAAELQKERAIAKTSPENNMQQKNQLEKGWGLDQIVLQRRVERNEMMKRSKEYATQNRAAFFGSNRAFSNAANESQHHNQRASLDGSGTHTGFTVGTPRFHGPDSFYPMSHTDNFSHCKNCTKQQLQFSPAGSGRSFHRSHSQPSPSSSYVQVLQQFTHSQQQQSAMPVEIEPETTAAAAAAIVTETAASSLQEKIETALRQSSDALSATAPGALSQPQPPPPPPCGEGAVHADSTPKNLVKSLEQEMKPKSNPKTMLKKSKSMPVWR